MQKNKLSFWVVLGCLMGTMAFSVQLSSADDEAKLMPMDLENTQWNIDLVISVDKNGDKKIEEDTLVFEGKKFFSKIYEKKGYGRSNYALTVSEDDVTSFGTMQMKGEGETAFWKGNVVDQTTLKGSVHFQHPSGKNETFYFTGNILDGSLKRKTKPKPRPAVEVPVTPPPQPVIEETPAVEAPIVVDGVVQAVVEDVDQKAPVESQVVDNE